jgi:hypothetical protein
MGKKRNRDITTNKKIKASCKNSEAKWFNKKLKLLLDLLEFSTPYGDEEHMHKFLPKGGTFDEKGNYIITTDKKSKTLFCCHLDTVGGKKIEVKPIYQNGWIYATSKKATCLGGDDRCGILCLLHLIEHKIPGTYIFHIGEEKGLIGARELEKTFDFSNFDRAIEFDRRGENSVITEMGVVKTCSDDFAEALCKELGLGYKPDNTGISTDTRAYEEKVPECTNISVGYRNEHTSNEVINADFLINDLLTSIIKIDWESLPTKRDPKANNKTYSTYTYNGSKHTYSDYYYDRDYEWDEYEDFYGSSRATSGFKYRKHTVATFLTHDKILRENGISKNCGDLLKNHNYIECELCGESESKFEDINIVGTDYLLCSDCATFLLEGWNSDQYNVEKEFEKELDSLIEKVTSCKEEEEEEEEEEDK